MINFAVIQQQVCKNPAKSIRKGKYFSNADLKKNLKMIVLKAF